MKYEIEILYDKPFKKEVDGNVIECKGTVEVIFYDNVIGTQQYGHTQQYGYITPKEIQQYIDAGKEIRLDYCYVDEEIVLNDKISLLSASHTFFDKKLSFRGIEFEREANFEWAFFGAEADFSKTRFCAGANFNEAQFNADAEFYGAKFNANAEFYGAKFNADAEFCGVEFGAESDFQVAQFYAETNFNYTKFGSKADFGAAVFCTETNFYEVQFGSKANFQSAIFGDKVDFSETQFGAVANFCAAKFCVEANFCNIMFISDVNLRNIISKIIVIRNCTVKSIIDLKNASIEQLSLDGTINLGRLEFTWVKSRIKEAIAQYDNNEDETLFFSKAKQYRLLKENFRSVGEYDEEDEAYVEYRRYLSLAKKEGELGKFKFDKCRYWFEKIVFDLMGEYGTNPLRIFGFLLSNIVIFGFIYYVLNCITENFYPGCYVYKDESNLGIIAPFYFSAITALTVGYGDISPTSKVVAILSCVEALISVFLMNYFTVAFTRKILR